MGTSYSSSAGIGIMLYLDDDEDCKKINAIAQIVKDKVKDKLKDYELNEDLNYFIFEYFKDDDIYCYPCGNFYFDNDTYFLFVSKGNDIHEMLSNVDKFVEAMNKYIPITKEEVGLVHCYNVS